MPRVSCTPLCCYWYIHQQLIKRTLGGGGGGGRETTILMLLLRVCVVFGAAGAAALTCRDEPLKGFKFCDSSLPIAERVADLAPRLNATERISQMSSGAKAVPHLGIEEYSFGAEALHGLGWASCAVDNLTAGSSGRTVCPTAFPAPTTLGAAFSRPLWRAMADATSTEARAFFHHNAVAFAQLGYPLKNPSRAPVSAGCDSNCTLKEWKQFSQKLKERTVMHSLEGTMGLSFYAPNVNLMRDPRWGRSSRRRDCHFVDALTPLLLKHLTKVEGGCSRMTVSPPARKVRGDAGGMPVPHQRVRRGLHRRLPGGRRSDRGAAGSRLHQGGRGRQALGGVRLHCYLLLCVRGKTVCRLSLKCRSAIAAIPSRC